jgi:hypothetical protein
MGELVDHDTWVHISRPHELERHAVHPPLAARRFVTIKHTLATFHPIGVRRRAFFSQIYSFDQEPLRPPNFCVLVGKDTIELHKYTLEHDVIAKYLL